MIKLRFFIIIFCIASLDSFSQSNSLKPHVDKVLGILKENSLYKDSVDWNELRNSTYDKIQGLNTKAELGEIYKWVLGELGEFHGAYFYLGKRFGMSNAPKEYDIGLSKGFRLGAKVRTEVLEGKYGYVFIPPMQWVDLETRDLKAKELQLAICQLTDKNVQDWIIDLRINLGGDMYAMLGGLNPFFEEGILGKFLPPDGKQTTWSISNGNVFEDNEQRTDLEILCQVNEDSKVAVLLSPLTSSSGEVVALSFKDKANTVLIGECTSGYTTAVEIFHIDSESLLHLSVARMADKNGIYQECIEPDITINGGDDPTQLLEDLKVQESIKWFNE